MAPKKGKAVKKAVASCDSDVSINDENAQQIDIQYDPEFVDSLLNDLKLQIDVKCNQIQKDCDFMSTSIRQAFHLELIKLPAQVQQMSLDRFKEEFGDSLEAVTRGAMAAMLSKPKGNISNASSSSSSSSNKSIYASAQKSARASSQVKVFQTPSGKNNSNYIPETPSTVQRVPKEGECILSANGSPLGEYVSTVIKPKASSNSILLVSNSSQKIPNQQPSLVIPLDSGELIDLDSIDIDTMSQEKKTETMDKMNVLLSQMNGLMSKIQKSNK